MIVPEAAKNFEHDSMLSIPHSIVTNIAAHRGESWLDKAYGNTTIRAYTTRILPYIGAREQQDGAVGFVVFGVNVAQGSSTNR